MDMRRLHVFFLTCIFCMSYFFTAFASPVASGSDAVSIASDSDASVDDLFPPISDFLEPAPMSSLANFESTIDFSGAYTQVAYDYDGKTKYQVIAHGTDRFVFDLNTLPADVYRLTLILYPDSLPPVGKYRVQWDFASDVGVEWTSFRFYARKDTHNADYSDVYQSIKPQVSSGDFYYDGIIDISNLSRLELSAYVTRGNYTGKVGGKWRVAFTPVSDSERTDFDSSDMPGISPEQDYQNTITNGVSSIGDTLKQIVQTISLQLEALWDQMFNFIHLPELEKMEQIRQAIENLDLNVEVNVDEINQQIQQSTDQVTNGYDNGGMTSDQERLDSVINEYDKAEDELFNDAKDHISGFEFGNYFEKYTGPLEDISYFLSGIYTKLGSLNIPIAFSLSLTIALLFIGYYRFKGGG